MQMVNVSQTLRDSILTKLSDPRHDAVSTLWELMLKPPDERVRLRADQTVLERFRLFQRDSKNVVLIYKYALKREDKITK